MGKLQDKRIELAKRVLDTTDKTRLDAVEIALLGVPPTELSEADIKDLERQVARIDQGEEKLHSWSDVKKRMAKSSRK